MINSVPLIDLGIFKLSVSSVSILVSYIFQGICFIQVVKLFGIKLSIIFFIMLLMSVEWL